MRLRNDVSTSFNKVRKRWLVRWSGKYDPVKDHQPRPCRTFKRKRDAERFAQSLKNDINDGICVEPKTISLKNLCDKFIKSKKGNVSPETIDAYQDTIERLLHEFVGVRNIKTISEEEAQSFINGLEYLDKKETLADYSRLKHLKASQAIFNYGVNCSFLRSSPFREYLNQKLVKR